MSELTSTPDCLHSHGHNSRSRLLGCILSGRSLRSSPNCRFQPARCGRPDLDGRIALSASTPSPLTTGVDGGLNY